MKKIIILIIMVMVIAVPALAKEYRSMCELHPEECAEGDLAMLGETVEQNDGNKYKVIAEAKLPTSPIWFQFIDAAPISGKFDGKCAFVGYFILKPDGFYVKTFSCTEAIIMLTNYCIANGVKYSDIVHKAK
jgi:hypothetical protein